MKTCIHKIGNYQARRCQLRQNQRLTKDLNYRDVRRPFLSFWNFKNLSQIVTMSLVVLCEEEGLLRFMEKKKSSSSCCDSNKVISLKSSEAEESLNKKSQKVDKQQSLPETD